MLRLLHLIDASAVHAVAAILATLQVKSRRVLMVVAHAL
jgi:hypothetical protein